MTLDKYCYLMRTIPESDEGLKDLYEEHKGELLLVIDESNIMYIATLEDVNGYSGSYTFIEVNTGAEVVVLEGSLYMPAAIAHFFMDDYIS